MKLQEIYEKYIGEFGRYQIFILCLLLTVRTPSVVHNMGFVFFARTPEHHCSYSRNPNINYTHEEWKLLSVPSDIKDGKRIWSSCMLYNHSEYVGNWTYSQTNQILVAIKEATSQSHAIGLQKCQHWQYDTTTDVKNSLVTEWDLVCDKKWMKSLIGSIYAAGWIIGSPITGYICDRFGRRKTLLVAGSMTIILGILNAFCSHYVAFVLCRFFLSLFLNGALAVAFTAAVEVVGASWRSFVSNLYMTIWAVGYMLLAGVAYLVRDRFTFMISTAAPTVIIVISLWFIPETVPWLIAKGRREEANSLVRKMARFNKKHLPDDLEVTVEKEVEKTTTSVLHLVATPNMRKKTFILCFAWFSMALLYYAISWNSIELHGDLYLNVFLGGFIEIPAYFLNIFALQYLGRRLSISGTTYLAGIALLVTLAISKDQAAVLASLTLASKFFITMAFCTIYQYTCELFPTVIRTLGLVMCNTCARFGTLMAPYMPLMVNEHMRFQQLPQLIIGILILLAATGLMFLPETLGCPLPMTVEQAEAFGKKINFRDIFRVPKRRPRKGAESGSEQDPAEEPLEADSPNKAHELKI